MLARLRLTLTKNDSARMPAVFWSGRSVFNLAVDDNVKVLSVIMCRRGSSVNGQCPTTGSTIIRRS